MGGSMTGLRARIAAAVVSLAIMTVAFLAGVWAIFYVLFALFGFGGAPVVATLVTVSVLFVIGYAEYRQRDAIERVAGAEHADGEVDQALRGMTTRIATQLDVPAPTVRVADRHTPEAMVVGFRPEKMHLVISEGVLDALDTTEELEAVIAHELAHVKNRDAMVMTAASAPVVLAGGMRARLDSMHESGGYGWGGIIVVPLRLLSGLVWFLGRTVTAQLSRGRELAADQAAVEVTGSPATLASALTKLDEEIRSTPSRDLRDVSAVSSLSILPLEPAEPDKIMLGPEGQKEPRFWWIRQYMHRLFHSHPPTDRRIERLSELERERHTKG